jgi:hypothetical protein
MKNRAKCKLCESIIESFHDMDYVSCKCGHISVSGGLKMECGAIDWNNFLRVDDKGNIIVVKVNNSNSDFEKDKTTSNPVYSENLTREDKIKMLDDIIKSYENLPKHVLESPINGYELTSVLILISSILRS